MLFFNNDAEVGDIIDILNVEFDVYRFFQLFTVRTPKRALVLDILPCPLTGPNLRKSHYHASTNAILIATLFAKIGKTHIST